MKIQKYFSRVIATAMSAVVVLLACVPALAKGTGVTMSISAAKYSNDRSAYVAASEAKPGETVYIKVNTTQITNLGGMAFKIGYNNKLFQFSQSNSACQITKGSDQTSYFVNKSGGFVQVTYDNTTYNTANTVTGEIFYLAFTVLDTNDTSNEEFSLTVKALYDNTSKQNDIAVNTNDSCSIKINSETISQSVIDALNKLKNIVYPDSKDDIDAATEIYKNLSAKQQSILAANYTTQFGYLSTATTRYNRLAEQASQKKINDEIAKFKSDHAAVLAKTATTVAISDKTAVDAADTAYNNCSVTAKTYLQDEAALIGALLERITELEEIKAEVDGFLNDENYSNIWDKSILNNNFDVNYVNYSKYVELALLCYNMMSDEAKAQVTQEYEWLSSLDAKCKELLSKDETAAALNEKVLNFQNAYLHVFTLNSNNVTLADQAAIQMVIDAYNALEDEELKAALKDKIDGFKELLDITYELEDGEDIEEEEEAEEETSTAAETIKTITKKITNTVENIIGGKTAYSNTVLILMLILSFAVAVLIATYILCQVYKRKAAQLTEGEVYEDDEYEY